jgi:hypothetical protein
MTIFQMLTAVKILLVNLGVIVWRSPCTQMHDSGTRCELHLDIIFTTICTSIFASFSINDLTGPAQKKTWVCMSKGSFEIHFVC